MPLRFRILAAPRAEDAPRAAGEALRLADGPADERTFALAFDPDELHIGRRRGNDIELPFPAVSSLHARLFRGDLLTDWRVEDLGSRNGTWVDGQRLLPRRPVPLRPGQRLRIATVDVVFEGWSQTLGGAESTATIARRLISDLFGVVGGDVATLTVESGPGREAELRLAMLDRRYLAGRSDACDLVLPSEHVSREHAAFVRRWDGVVVSDLGSRNGVLVNARAITGEHRLADGDRITVGPSTMRLIDPEDRYLRRLESLDPPLAPGVAGGAAHSPKSSANGARPTPSESAARIPTPAFSPAVASPDLLSAGASEPSARIGTPAVFSVVGPPAAQQPDSRDSSDRVSPRKRVGWVLTTLTAAVVIVAVAGLVALWLAMR